MTRNPKGRVDVLARALAERLTHERLEPRIGNVPVWDVLKPIAEQGIKAGMKSLGVPCKNLLNSGFGKALEAALDRTRVSGGCA
jgi:hypothetical protein